MDVRLSARAKDQLRLIGEYTVERFGEVQAARYRGRLQQGFATLSTFPSIGMASRELPRGCLGYRVAEHWVCYEVRRDEVQIVAIVRRLSEIMDS